MYSVVKKRHSRHASRPPVEIVDSFIPALTLKTDIRIEINHDSLSCLKYGFWLGFSQ